MLDIEKMEAAALAWKRGEACYYVTPQEILELIEKYKALEAKYERLKPRHEAYVKMLGELLAVLHADGGHYQYEHGTEKAVEDSITKHYELKRQLAEYKADVERYRWLKADGKAMCVDSFNGNYRVVDMSVNLVVTEWVDSFDEAIDEAKFNLEASK